MKTFKEFIIEKKKQKKVVSPIKSMDFSNPDDPDAGYGYWNFSVPSTDNRVVD
jgi:hypothetical protein